MGSVIIAVRVSPRSGRDEIAGVDAQGALRLRVAAPPVDGQANEAVVRLLASVLDLPRSSIELVSGVSTRHKRVLLDGIEGDVVRRRWPGISVDGS